MQRIRDLLEQAPMLRHFLNERGFVYGSLFGEPGLLLSLGSTNHLQSQRFFDAGCLRDAAALLQMDADLHQISAAFHSTIGRGEQLIDGAFDKVLWRLHDRRFPLRLLPPYRGASQSAADEFLAWLRLRFPTWAPQETA